MWNGAEREALYDQARMAMIKKLRALRPAISAEEIQERIGQFEAAVEKVEADVAVAEQFRHSGRDGDADRAQAQFDDADAYYDEEDDLVIEGTAQRDYYREPLRALPAPPAGPHGSTKTTTPSARRRDAPPRETPMPAMRRTIMTTMTMKTNAQRARPTIGMITTMRRSRPDAPPASGRSDARPRRDGDRWSARSAPPAKPPHDLDKVRTYLQRSLNRLRGEPAVSGYGAEEVVMEPHARRSATPKPASRSSRSSCSAGQASRSCFPPSTRPGSSPMDGATW